jgi:hypothetical protein
MKFKFLAACGVVACCMSNAAFAQTAATDTVAATPAAPITAQALPQVGPGSMLPSNTDIWLTLDRKLDSHDVKVGDPLAFKVARDVMLGNYIIIPRGTPANGRISLRSGRGAFGKSAKLEFEVDTVNLSGHPIPVSGHFRISGEGNTGATIGAVAAAGLIGGVFVKGRSATAEEGSEWKVSTKEPVAIAVGASN